MAVQLIRKVRNRQPTIVVGAADPADHVYNFDVSRVGSKGISSTLVGGGSYTAKGLYGDGTSRAAYLGDVNGTKFDPRTGDFTLVCLLAITSALGSGVNGIVCSTTNSFFTDNHWDFYARGDGSGKHAIRSAMFGVYESPYIYGTGENIVIVVQRKGTEVTLISDGQSGLLVSKATITTDFYNRLGIPLGFLGGQDGSYPLNGVVKMFCMKANANISALDLAKNPWQIFEPETIPLFYSTVTAQYARPTSDVSSGTWTASTGSDLYAMLDETAANDTDYITTTGTSTCEVALTSLGDPSSSTGHIVRYRISATSGGITVRLRQGTTTIATWTHASAPTSLTTYEQTLSSGEADSITDYTALKLQFEATA